MRGMKSSSRSESASLFDASAGASAFATALTRKRFCVITFEQSTHEYVQDKFYLRCGHTVSMINAFRSHEDPIPKQ